MSVAKIGDKEKIEFYTQEERLRVSELNDFLNSLSNVYNILFILHVFAYPKTSKESSHTKELRKFLIDRFLVYNPTGEYQKSQLIAIFRDFENQLAPEERLVINRIRIGSPGIVTVEAKVGDVVKQTRELIKDLWYRNRAQKTMSRLDILARIIELMEKEKNLMDLGPALPTEMKDLSDKILSALAEEVDKLKSTPFRISHTSR